jgi:hypothetical protein
MEDRIGALHLHYRVRGGGSLGPALTPGFDRAVQAGLAEALGLRMAGMLGDDPSVVVIRELKASVVLDKRDCTLDSRVVERICMSSVDAAATMLSRDVPTASVMRFADEAEFVGSFIVDLIDGSAWTHWYYGAFHRYRRADAGTTLRAVLAESGVEVARVFAWLSRRGQLSAVMTLLAPSDARRLLGSDAESSVRLDDCDGVQVLADAAIQLLTQMGWDFAESGGRAQIVHQFLAARPIAPAWADRRSLSAWVLEFVRFVVNRPGTIAPAIHAQERGAIHTVLTGPLDWLDAPWLCAQLAALAHGPSFANDTKKISRRALLTPGHDRILDQLARRLRDGRIRIATGDGEDALVVRLIAAVSEEAPGSGPLDRTLITVVEQVARTYFAILDDANSGRQPNSFAGPTAADVVDLPYRLDANTVSRVKALRAAGDSAVELLRALVSVRPESDESGALTHAAGVFLLARAVLDVRLPASARQFGIPLPPLLSGLAIKWLGRPWPCDQATSLWAGAERSEVAELDTTAEPLHWLNEVLVELLIDRHTLDAETAREVIAVDAALLTHELECSAQTNAEVASTASLLLRAWGQWLPGIGAASSAFLLDKCVRRAGRVHVSEDRVAVQLHPAPLDVVLQMAGYLAPIERVPWLGDRTVSFTLRRIAVA